LKNNIVIKMLKIEYEIFSKNIDDNDKHLGVNWCSLWDHTERNSIEKFKSGLF